MKHLQKASGRVRCFSLVSYLSEIQITSVLVNHRNQIRVYAYAYHDKDVYLDDEYDTESGEVVHSKGDLKQAHYHILLITYNATTLSAVRRWFYGWKDEDGKNINTLGKTPPDKFQAYDYLTHSDADSVFKGKYQYPSSIINTNDPNYFLAHEHSEYDASQLIVQDLLKGTDYEIMWKRYGKNFILNHRTYISFCNELNTFGHYDFNERIGYVLAENTRPSGLPVISKPDTKPELKTRAELGIPEDEEWGVGDLPF